MPVFFHFVGAVKTVGSSSGFRDAQVLHQNDIGEQKLATVTYWANEENNLVSDKCYLFTGTAIVDANNEPKFSLISSVLLPLDTLKLPLSKINMTATITILSTPLPLEESDDGEAQMHFDAQLSEYDPKLRKQVQTTLTFIITPNKPLFQKMIQHITPEKHFIATFGYEFPAEGEDRAYGYIMRLSFNTPALTTKRSPFESPTKARKVLLGVAPQSATTPATSPVKREGATASDMRSPQTPKRVRGYGRDIVDICSPSQPDVATSGMSFTTRQQTPLSAPTTLSSPSPYPQSSPMLMDLSSDEPYISVSSRIPPSRPDSDTNAAFNLPIDQPSTSQSAQINLPHNPLHLGPQPPFTQESLSFTADQDLASDTPLLSPAALSESVQMKPKRQRAQPKKNKASQ